MVRKPSSAPRGMKLQDASPTPVPLKKRSSFVTASCVGHYLLHVVHELLELLHIRHLIDLIQPACVGRKWGLVLVKRRRGGLSKTVAR